MKQNVRSEIVSSSDLRPLGVVPRLSGCRAAFRRAGGWLTLELGQVGRQVIDEPSVPGPEHLGLRGLGFPHHPEPIVVGVKGHGAVVADPELLPASSEEDVLGREAQEAGVGVDGLLPSMGRLRKVLGR